MNRRLPLIATAAVLLSICSMAASTGSTAEASLADDFPEADFLEAASSVAP
jgi:hypothetical protein